MKQNRVLYLCRAAMVAALYVALTGVSALFGLDAGPVQCRLGEALCVLPLFLPSAVPGLAVGCFAANLLFCPTPPDLIFGTLATLLGALGCRALAKIWKSENIGRAPVATLPNTLANTVIIPMILRYAYGIETGWWLLLLQAGAGELLSSTLLGTLLAWGIMRRWKGRQF